MHTQTDSSGRSRPHEPQDIPARRSASASGSGRRVPSSHRSRCRRTRRRCRTDRPRRPRRSARCRESRRRRPRRAPGLGELGSCRRSLSRGTKEQLKCAIAPRRPWANQSCRPRDRGTQGEAVIASRATRAQRTTGLTSRSAACARVATRCSWAGWSAPRWDVVPPECAARGTVRQPSNGAGTPATTGFRDFRSYLATPDPAPD